MYLKEYVLQFRKVCYLAHIAATQHPGSECSQRELMPALPAKIFFHFITHPQLDPVWLKLMVFFFFFLVQIGVTPVVFGAKVSRRIGSNDMPFKTQTKIPPCNSVPLHCPSPTLQECFLTVPINFKIECFLSFRVVVVCAETDTWINIKK